MHRESKTRCLCVSARCRVVTLWWLTDDDNNNVETRLVASSVSDGERRRYLFDLIESKIAKSTTGEKKNHMCQFSLSFHRFNDAMKHICHVTHMVKTTEDDSHLIYTNLFNSCTFYQLHCEVILTHHPPWILLCWCQDVIHLVMMAGKSTWMNINTHIKMWSEIRVDRPGGAYRWFNMR